MHPSADRDRLAVLILGFLAAVVYLPIIGGGFLIWDDNVNLLQNEALNQAPGRFLCWAFTDLETVQRYKPLNWLLWRGIITVAGLNPVALHACGLVLHAVNTGLLFLLIRRFLARSATVEPVRLFAAMAATALWAFHPLRVEPVAWISGVGYPLATSFALLTLRAFIGELENPAAQPRGAALAWFLISLFCYPAAAGLPGLLFCLCFVDYAGETGLSPRFFRAFRRVLHFVGASALILGLTLLTRHTTLSDVWREPVSVQEIGWGVRSLQAFFVWAWYLQKTLLPLGLSPVYSDVWQLTAVSAAAWTSVVMLVAITAAVWAARRNWPEAFPLWIGYLVLATPTLGIFDLPFSPADRYSYVPALALALLFATGLVRLIQSRKRTGQFAIGAAVVAAAVCYLALTCVELQAWQSPEAFFQRAIARLQPHRGTADLHWRLGLHYLTMGRTDAAARQFNRVLEIDPHHPDVARYLQELGKRSGAVPPKPEFPVTHAVPP